MPTTQKTVARNDGGPAFPSPTANTSQHGQLSVRDYFAAQALPAVYAAAVANGSEAQENIVAEAYELADAMLEERAK